MYLDIRTIIFLAALFSLLMGMAIFVAARSYNDYIRGMRRWGVACGCQGLAWLLACARGHIPDFLSIVIANTMLIVAATFYYQALREFNDEAPPHGSVYALSALLFTSFLYFTYVVPDMVIRIGLVSLIGALLLFACARTILAQGEPERPFSYWLTGLAFLVLALASVFRGLYMVAASGLWGQTPVGLFDHGNLQNISYIFSNLAVVVLTFGFVLMCGDKFNSNLHRLATLDSLTGSLNRGTMDLLIRKELSRSQRDGSTLSILLMDLDHFKRINDSFGHGVGDRVLQQFVTTISAHLRSHDLLGRFGGEEFIILLPNCSTAEAIVVAERIRLDTEQATVLHEQTPVCCTVSIGIATHHSQETDHIALLHRADKALYVAKNQGRNRIVVADEL
ncbi:MAG: hypothetical protein JWN98_1536 [Abditibacteriota bacterium]|nr:hypothetical protein [Abditibacteriota bacterium]